MLGADLTVKLAGRNYLTVAGSVRGGLQATVQHRVLNTSYLGVTMGPAVRRTYHTFEVVDYGGGAPSWPSYPSVRTHSIGVRGLALLRPESAFSGGLLGLLYVGYVPEFRRPEITFGVSLGVF